MVYLEVGFFLQQQHQEFDLTAHLNADMVTLAGLFLMLIYIWDLHFHECLMLFHMAAVDISAFDSGEVLKKCCTESPPRHKLFICPDIY